MKDRIDGTDSSNLDLDVADKTDDATRIAASRKKNSVENQNDRTQIASKRPNKRSVQQTQNKAVQPDKTRIDKSRVNPASAKQAQVDKTRVQPSMNRRQNDGEKTRVADKRPLPSTASADKTRFQAPPQKNRSPQARNSISNQPERSSVAVDRGGAQSQGSTQDESILLKKRFVLEKVLGAGGMGVVYKAKDLVKVEAGDKDPYVAIKVLTEEFKEHPEAFVALQRESRKTQRIAHPNIVNVHDFDKDKGTVFMTMEFLEGKPLDQLIRQYQSTGLPTDDAFDIFESVSQALIYAHGQNIIHSDFKPGNIFVTDKGVTKVFDFGIARAVAKAEHHEDNPEDKTIFDAGDLGALTPAYASLEMLNGFEPDIRDDIYALGCVAYELFTGKHPFNKVPADEAKKQKLKPKRISQISRKQWKAIQKSLSFERENRLSSVEEFLALMTEKTSRVKWGVMFGFVLAASAGLYFQYSNQGPAVFDESEIRSELEFKLRMESFRDKLDGLVDSALFTENWENEVWLNVQAIKIALDPKSDLLSKNLGRDFLNSVDADRNWFNEAVGKLASLYSKEIESSIESKSYEKAQVLIENAKRYITDESLLEKYHLDVLALIKKLEAEKLAAEKEKERLAAQSRAEALVKQKQQKARQAAVIKDREYQAALSNVNDQIACLTNRLDMRNLSTAVNKLISINRQKYKNSEQTIISALAACIQKIGEKYPERAEEFKSSALKLFANNNVIAAINIVPRDPCSASLAGLGGRGKRTICKDTIKDIGSGPEMVVIPPASGIRMFAIGKYEVSASEFEAFCKASKQCSVKNANPNFPMTNVSLSLVEKYLAWLSSKSNQKYRLPTHKEWSHAAKSSRLKLDPNRNCKLKSRGISKGDSFVRAKVGAQNSWGLVNYIGNANEWVWGSGRQLLAVGGAYNVAMDSCDFDASFKHSGDADKLTGFRVLREIK